LSERTLKVLDLGRCDYDEAWELQKTLHAQIVGDPATPDHLILVEHPPVITLGRRAEQSNVLFTEESLGQQGVQLRRVDRGGDVTYHGPGQLVAYPIMRLTGKDRDVHRYFRMLEQMVIDLLADYGVEAGRQPEYTGVWVGESKVCAMGVAIKRWTTYHGIALNVATDLDHFKLITPCGIVGKGVTSMKVLLGRDVPMAEIADKLVEHFARHFSFSEVIR
jgi:lipoate-protein ligase B